MREETLADRQICLGSLVFGGKKIDCAPHEALIEEMVKEIYPSFTHIVYHRWLKNPSHLHTCLAKSSNAVAFPFFCSFSI